MEEEKTAEGEALETQGEVATPEEATVDYEELKKKAELAENYKIRAEKAEKLLKTKQVAPQAENQIDSIDQIKLGKKLHDYSDDELDFVTEHAKSKKPEDILKVLEDPFVQAAIQGHRDKLEKERLTLTPSSTQSDSDKPKSLAEKLTNASVAEKEKLLSEAGYYKSPRPKLDRTNIGSKY